MRRDQPTTPFDVEAEELTQEFWGATKGWVSSEQPTVRSRAERPDRGSTAHRDDTTGSLRAIRDGFAAFRPQTSSSPTGEIRRQRHHGAPAPAGRADAAPDRDDFLRAARREATLGELAAGRSDVGGWFDEDLDDAPAPRRSRTPHSRNDRAELDHSGTEPPEPDYEVPLSPVQPLVERLGLGAVDPLLVRAGAIALALILLVPVMLSLRPERTDDTLPGDVVEAPQPATGAAPPSSTQNVASQPAGASTSVVTTVAATAEPADAADGSDIATVAASDADRSTFETAAPVEEIAGADATSDTDADAAAAVDVVAERLVPDCPQTYTAAVGDSWYRIADEAGVTPDELLAENLATTDTVILPGDDICLPDGAAMPSPPTSEPPPADEPSEELPSATTAPTTTAPTTTVAPVVELSRSEVQELIRETWPEEEVDQALAVAKRESNFVATADNGWCCVGVFQLYWTVHRNWLDDFGITERSDLFDARKNIAAAYHMWQAQGWGPWGG